MAVMLALVGAILGAFVAESRHVLGFFAGGFIGYLLVSLSDARRAIAELKQQVQDLSPDEQAVEAPTETKPAGTSPARSETRAARVVTDTPEPARPDVIPEPVTDQESTPQTPSSDVAGFESAPSPLPASWQAKAGDSVESGLDPFAYVKKFFTGGNTAVRIGIVVLFFGVSFLLKYAVDHAKLPIELRFIGSAIFAMVLLGIGWRLRQKRETYALVLQGGGVGILYITVFAALKLYHLIPPGIAFVLLVGIAVFSAMLAVLQNAMSLAVFGSAGGFLAPILASTGSGNHVMLFSYYTLLNLGILGIAWYRSWRLLNLIGFGFTFGIAALWGHDAYKPELFATTEPFLVIFFLIYAATSLLFSIRQEPELRGYVDGTLVFGTPVVAFGLQYELVHIHEYGLAWSALVLGVFYLSLATVLFRRAAAKQKLLTEAYLALGAIFASLTIPLAFDNHWTSAVWALEGAGILWVGIHQKRFLARVFALLLQAGAAVSFFVDVGYVREAVPVFNPLYLGCLVISLSALFSGHLIHRHRDKLNKDEAGLHVLLLAWGLLWWFGGGLVELDRQVDALYLNRAILLFLLASIVACFYLARLLAWREMAAVTLGLVPVGALALLGDVLTVSHPMQRYGVIVWPIYFAVCLWLLRQMESKEANDGKAAGPVGFQHVGLFWLLIGLATWQSHWWVGRQLLGEGLWSEITLAVVPALFVLLASSRLANSRWPVSTCGRSYLLVGAAPILVYLVGWTLLMNLTSNGNPWPISYLPLLNPLDLTIGLIAMTVLAWYLRCRANDYKELRGEFNQIAGVIVGGVAFIWVNAILIRTLHHWGGVAFEVNAIFSSVLVQASLSIFWGLLALALMITGTRMALRPPWLAGAVLLGVTVVKLFVIDLSKSGTVERIVSFIAVGILLLLVGYLSPVPPKQTEEAVE